MSVEVMINFALDFEIPPTISHNFPLAQQATEFITGSLLDLC
jgi:hypothetical protein